MILSHGRSLRITRYQGNEDISEEERQAYKRICDEVWPETSDAESEVNS